MKREIRQYLNANHPRVAAVVERAYNRAMTEWRILRHLDWGSFVRGAFRGKGVWREVLPIQRPSRWVLPAELGITDLAALSGKPGVADGGHAFYLSPTVWERSPLARFRAGYPADAGIKILRTEGGVEQASYLHVSESTVYRQLLYSPKHLTLVAGSLHRLGVGPRWYDLVEISSGGRTWTGFVVAHAGDRVPAHAEWAVGMGRIKEAVAAGHLGLIGPDGLAHQDFRDPDCSGNAFLDETGSFRFVDFQNFVLPEYARDLEALAKDASIATHFGDKSLLRGGAYLYQSVPGVALPAKRRVESRIPAIERLLASAGATVEGKLVLDVGCNIGMMMGQYLRLGAGWCHGWDMERVTPHTARLLEGLGCGRFSLTGGQLTLDRPLAADLPPHAAAMLDGCVISYLAIRGHVAWLEALGTIPWEIMIYEGHEGEDRARTEQFLAELQQRVPGVTVTGLDRYVDGDSGERWLGVLRRKRA